VTARTATLALLLASCGGPFPHATIDVGGKTVKVEVAATPELRARGLMNRDGLSTGHGMIFIYPDEAPRSFWMKNVPFPLDIGFADATGRLVHVTEMKPFDTSSTPSLYPAKYALEMNKGWFQKNQVKKGAQITGIPEVAPK